MNEIEACRFDFDGAIADTAKYHFLTFVKKMLVDEIFTEVEAAKNTQMYCVDIGNREVLKEANVVIPGFENFGLTKLKTLFGHQ